MNLKQQQQVLTQHLRDPDKHAGPEGIEDRRLDIYRGLFFNNIENFISSAFPIFRSLFSEDEWLALVREFFADYQCSTPYFLKISEEFLAFLGNEELSVHKRFPFVQELCHYEWVELGLDVEETNLQLDEYSAQLGGQTGEGINPNGDLLNESVVVSPLAWPLIYAWPVHEIGPQNIPSQPSEQPTCLVVYRSRLEQVEFMQANPATIRLLQLFQEADDQMENPFVTGQEAINQLAVEMGQIALGEKAPEAFVQFALETLNKLRELGIIIGSIARSTMA